MVKTMLKMFDVVKVKEKTESNYGVKDMSFILMM